MRVWISPDTLFASVTIVAMLGIALAGSRAFYVRTQSRFVLGIIIAMIVAANTVPLIGIPGIDANAGTALVAVIGGPHPGRNHHLIASDQRFASRGSAEPAQTGQSSSGPARCSHRRLTWPLLD